LLLKIFAFRFSTIAWIKKSDYEIFIKKYQKNIVTELTNNIYRFCNSIVMIENKISSLGIRLFDKPPVSAGAYIPIVITGNLAFISGQIPIEDDSIPPKVKLKGKVGKDISLEDGQKAARLCTINALSHIKNTLGSLDKIKKFVKVSGFVNCDPSFTEHSKVINEASDLLMHIFGEKGRHARIAVGASSLPLNSSVEIEFIVEI
jgi:enamine deaminase RidA (YjgF/YER057c/UK114 family)